MMDQVIESIHEQLDHVKNSQNHSRSRRRGTQRHGSDDFNYEKDEFEKRPRRGRRDHGQIGDTIKEIKMTRPTF